MSLHSAPSKLSLLGSGEFRVSTYTMLWKKRKSVGDNEAFVTLIRVAQDDPEVHATLAAILRQPPFHRKSLLNTVLQDMKARSAPKHLISAMTELLDDAVAEKVAEVILRYGSQERVPNEMISSGL